MSPAAPPDRSPDQGGVRAQSPRRFVDSPLYLAAWLCIATASAGYMATLAVRPEMVGGLAVVETPQAAALAAVETEELATLRTAAATLMNELSSLRANLASAETREQALKERLTALEARADAAPAIEPKPKAASVAQKPVRPPARLETSSTEPTEAKAKAPPPTGDWRSTTRLLNAPPSIAVPPLPPAQPRASLDRLSDEPRSGAVGIQLATGSSVDELRHSWTLLNERHRGTLRALEPRVSTANGSTYELVAGPIANEADALRICSELQFSGIACRPARFGGQGL